VDGFNVSAASAVLLGLVAMPVAFIPYIAWSFHRGTTGVGHALITASGLIYVMALWTYTLVPLPNPESLVCTGDLHAQLRPFDFVRTVSTDGGLVGILHDSMARQVFLNVCLFVPLGALVRHLFAVRLRWCLVAGLAVSALIEFTQLTGDWFIYPCAYRLFDVDDLLANTLGAGLGALMAPLLRLIPGQHRYSTRAPRTVRPLRRLAGMAVDLLSVFLVGIGTPLAVRFALYFTGHDYRWHTVGIQVAATALAAIVLLWIVPLTSGATLGQHLVFLRPVRRDGQRPRWYQWLVRAVTGAGGFVLLTLPADAGIGPATQLGLAWVAISAVVVAFVTTRGISGVAAGLEVVDSRHRDVATAVADHGTDPRRLSSAVVVLAAVVYGAVAALLSIAAASPRIGTGIEVVVAVAVVAANLALAGYVVFTSVLAVRREGRHLSNLLGLFLVAGVVVMVALLGVALATGWTWLLIGTVAALALGAHTAVLLTAFAAYGALYARLRVRGGMDAIVVLGSRVFGTQVPPLLAARIDKGLQVLAAEGAQGHHPLLVLSGGQGADEYVPEADAMATYALAHGAREDQVRIERASRTTQDNLAYSRDLLLAEGHGTTLVVATNDFHAFRTAIIARELGIDAQVVGAPTARYYYPSAVLREFVAVLSRSPGLHVSVGVVVMAAAGVLTWLVAGA